MLVDAGDGAVAPRRPGRGGGWWWRRWGEGDGDMPGPIWEWSSARDFDPLPDLPLLLFGPSLLNFLHNKILPLLYLAPGYFFSSHTGLFFFSSLLHSSR